MAVTAVLLTGCSDGEGASEDGEAAVEEPGVTIADRPAPSGWSDDDLVRLDQVARDGDTVTIDLTVAARTDRSFQDHDGQLEPTVWNPRGRVATTVEGRSGGEADTVDPDAAAEAEASLEDLGAERTPDGLVVTLPETVLFEFDSADLVGDADEVVARVAEILEFYADVEVEVRGHTDDVGEDEYNQELSESRAEAVVDALIDAGASPSQLTAIGFGASDPIAPNSTPSGEDDPEGRQRNRRVEIVLRE